MRSPNLFNSYASPTACHLYDPWSKQKNSWKLFIADLGSALLQGATCGTVKSRVLELPANQVIGYKEIYNQDQISYQTETQQQSMKYVAGVDYSFLPGLSCGAAASNTIINGTGQTLPGYYTDLIISACDGKSTTEYTVDRNVTLDPVLNKIVRTDKNTNQLCFKCSFGLTAIAKYSCVAPYVGQIAAAGIGIFQGVLRLISNLTDPDNIIKTEQLNIDQISESYMASDIKETSCHNDLKRGITCKAPRSGR
jgi:hypothetical protein